MGASRYYTSLLKFLLFDLTQHFEVKKASYQHLLNFFRVSYTVNAILISPGCYLL